MRTALAVAPPTAIQKATEEQTSPTLDRPAVVTPPPASRPQDRMWDNLTGVKDKDFVDLNFKVKLDLRTDFKQTAAAWNMSNKELMLSCYTLFLERYGRTPREAAQKLQQGIIETDVPPLPQENTNNPGNSEQG